jgi:hypothetical protein
MTFKIPVFADSTNEIGVADNSATPEESDDGFGF